MSRTREAMAKDIEISLNNFRTNYIDLYQVHNPNMEQLEQVIGPDGALEALLEAKAAGKIGHLGLTAHSLEVFEKALEMDWVETIMFPYNIVERQGEELIHKCREKNIGFIDMKPLAGGAIEDGRLALRFVCANSDVTVVIPGMYDVSEIEKNREAVEDTRPLTEEELAAMEQVRKQLGTNFCRRCNYCQPCTAGNQHFRLLSFPGISGPLWPRRLGKGTLCGYGGEGRRLCGLRRLRDPLPIQSANP